MFGGLAIVLLHNYWSGGALTVIITLLGWLTLIKAVLLLVLPSTKLVALYGGVSPTYILISCSGLTHRRRFPGSPGRVAPQSPFYKPACHAVNSHDDLRFACKAILQEK